MVSVMFTFVVPSINRPTLPATVQSILDQNIKDWKLIICSDGTDVPKFSDERIISIRVSCGNATCAREAALPLIDTEWVAFVDDDDWITPDYLDHFMKFVESSDVIISQMMNYGTAIPEIHAIDHGHVGISFAIRTEVWRNNKMPPPPSEDYKFLHLLEVNKYRIAFTDYCGYFVRKYLYDNN